MIIEPDVKLDFNDVLLRPAHSQIESRKDVVMERTFYFYHSPREWTGVPVMCSNMSFAGIELGKALAEKQMITCLHKFHEPNQLIELYERYPDYMDYIWMTIGRHQNDLAKACAVSMCVAKSLGSPSAMPNICIDVPNGHIASFVEYCREVREALPLSIIMAGNVADAGAAEQLVVHGGVDIVKCGIGPGSACLTRKVTGVGVPQLSNIIECSSKVHGLQKPKKPGRLGLICSDGGCRDSGDVAKGFCGGADFIMLGGYWAGVDECDGDWQYEYQEDIFELGNPNPMKIARGPKTNFTYYGMSSLRAQRTHYNEVKSYRASEGEEIEVPFKGTAAEHAEELLGGLRSTGTYIGAERLKDFSKCARFIRVNRIK